MLSIEECIQIIKDECEYLINSSTNLTFNEFVNNEDLKRAFIRSLEVIGESVKNLPDNFKKQYTDIPWRNIAKMRDKLAHDLLKIDMEIIWDTVINRIPELKTAIDKINLD